MRFVLIICLLLAVGCQTVTIRPDGGAKDKSEATVSESQTFFLGGLVPSANYINVDKACDGKEVAQMQTKTTFLNAFLGAITLGIYSPRTTGIWCGKSSR